VPFGRPLSAKCDLDPDFDPFFRVYKSFPQNCRFGGAPPELTCYNTPKPPVFRLKRVKTVLPICMDRKIGIRVYIYFRGGSETGQPGDKKCRVITRLTIGVQCAHFCVFGVFAIFGHFWPFLPFLAIFGSFLECLQNTPFLPIFTVFGRFYRFL